MTQAELLFLFLFDLGVSLPDEHGVLAGRLIGGRLAEIMIDIVINGGVFYAKSLLRWGLRQRLFHFQFYFRTLDPESHRREPV